MSATPDSSIHCALARLEARAESSASGWRLLMYAIILAPLAEAAPLLFGRYEPPSLLGQAAMVSLGLGLISIWYGLAVRRDVRRRLEDSNLAASIARGELEAAELRAAMPWPWRTMIRDEASLDGTLRRVANDLDWYLKAEKRRNRGIEPARLLRLYWIYLPLALLVSTALQANLAYIMYMSFMLRSSIDALHVYLFLGNLFPLWLLPFVFYRRQVWAQELARYLREQLEADGETPAAT